MSVESLIPGALQDALRDARHVCVLTGAGISAESGVPTFREAQTGLWEQYDPQDLATLEAFVRDPALVWFGEAIPEAALNVSCAATH